MKLNDRGLSLIEVMISLVIMTAGVLALVQAFQGGMFISGDNEQRALAIRIAQSRMEEVKDTDFDDLADAGPAADTAFSGFDVEVDVEEGADPMEVAVTVTWPVKKGSDEVVLTTLVSDL